jgi:hypothetical protein
VRKAVATQQGWNTLGPDLWLQRLKYLAANETGAPHYEPNLFNSSGRGNSAVRIYGRSQRPGLMLWNGTAIWLISTSLKGASTLTRLASCVSFFKLVDGCLFLARRA